MPSLCFFFGGPVPAIGQVEQAPSRIYVCITKVGSGSLLRAGEQKHSSSTTHPEVLPLKGIPEGILCLRVLNNHWMISSVPWDLSGRCPLALDGATAQQLKRPTLGTRVGCPPGCSAAWHRRRAPQSLLAALAPGGFVDSGRYMGLNYSRALGFGSGGR